MNRMFNQGPIEQGNMERRSWKNTLTIRARMA